MLFYIIGINNFLILSGFVGELFCWIVVLYYFVFIFGIVLVYIIMCLLFERWFVVVKFVWYRVGFKSYRIYIMVVIVWFILFLFNVFYFFEMKLGFENYCEWVLLMMGDVRRGVVLIEFLGKFFVLFVIICLLFLSLWVKVWDLLVLF